MITVTLLEKVYGSFSTQMLETILEALCRDLKVSVKVQGKTTRDWIQIQLSGEDEPVALRLLDKQVGLAPVSAEQITRFSTLRGKIVGTDKAMREMRVDVGVFEPTAYEVFIPLQRLQAQLADGKGLPLQQLIELFCLHEHAPLEIKILNDFRAEGNRWEAELSETQLSQFSNWLWSNLDRLLTLGTSRKQVEEAVSRTGHFRDVVKIETLGPFEHVVVCKLGTDAVGLLPRVGSHLRRTSLYAFSPRRTRKELAL